MVNGIETIKPCGLNKEFASKFYVSSRLWHGTPEEGRKMHQPKRYEFNEDEDRIHEMIKIIMLHLRNLDK